ncbi:hypothetical protein [Caldifermentibacillus hisashii]|uniref:hypothetical protein n=1 Tax=Caldifermentibacillus hisashii TaxID=996558 RepID=UPI0034273E31
MATRPFLVTILSRKTLFFGDEAHSRRHFWVRNSFFGRRDLFSSPFSAEKLHFLTTRFILVAIFSRKTLFFGDETQSRHHFQPKTLFFGDEAHSRHHFQPRNSIF